jgi:purine-binding chemotaxis protein CheW
MNLRGEILPIFDLGTVLENAAAPEPATARILVLGRQHAELGVLADAVGEVTNVRDDALRAPPSTMAAAARSYVRGVADDAVVVLDGVRVLEDPRFFLGRGADGEGGSK